MLEMVETLRNGRDMQDLPPVGLVPLVGLVLGMLNWAVAVEHLTLPRA